MKRIRKKNINTVKYWDDVYLKERNIGKRRLYTVLWNDMLRFFPDTSQTMIDIGCGAGEFLKFIHSQFEYKLYGFDFSNEAIKSAKNTCPEAIFSSDFEFFRKIGFKFDVCVASEIFEHIEVPSEFMKKIIGLIKKKGLLIITTPWCWGGSDPEHVWDYESSEDFVAISNGKLVKVDSIIGNNGRTLISVFNTLC